MACEIIATIMPTRYMQYRHRLVVYCGYYTQTIRDTARRDLGNFGTL